MPFSINAQTEADIQRSGANTIEDLSRNVAGLSIQNLGPGPRLGCNKARKVRELSTVHDYRVDYPATLYLWCRLIKLVECFKVYISLMKRLPNLSIEHNFICFFKS